MAENEEKIQQGWNPLKPPMVEKQYVKELVDNSGGQFTEEEMDIPTPEPTYIKPPVTSGAENTENPDDENPDFKGLTHSEKLKLAEKSADAYLESYSKVIPIPFIKISSFNMRKMKKLDEKGEISLQMKIGEDGLTTTESYMNNFNTDVEKIFTFTDDIKKDIKEPLVEVIMENGGLVASPTQRLLLAVSGHLLQMTQSTAELLMRRRDDIEVFKEFKANDDAEKLMLRQTPPPGNAPQQNTPSPDPVTEKEEVQEAQTQATNDDIDYEEVVVPYQKPPVGFTVEEYINDENVVIEEITD